MYRLYYNTANNAFGFALQLYSFYTPTNVNILTPIFQGAWMTLMVVTRGILVFMDVAFHPNHFRNQY